MGFSVWSIQGGVGPRPYDPAACPCKRRYPACLRTQRRFALIDRQICSGATIPDRARRPCPETAWHAAPRRSYEGKAKILVRGPRARHPGAVISRTTPPPSTPKAAHVRGKGRCSTTGVRVLHGGLNAIGVPDAISSAGSNDASQLIRQVEIHPARVVVRNARPPGPSQSASGSRRAPPPLPGPSLELLLQETTTWADPPALTRAHHRPSAGPASRTCDDMCRLPACAPERFPVRPDAGSASKLVDFKIEIGPRLRTTTTCA